jgi:hypothetical protein
MSDDQVVSELAAMRRELETLRAQRTKRWRLVLVAGLLAAGVALAQPVLTTFNADAPALASEVNTNFSNLRAWSVPAGAVLLFEGTCPTGYTELTAARGRVVVGSPVGATANTQIGTALTNGEDRTLAHFHGGTTVDFAGYGNGEVNYSVQVGFASPWMIRQTIGTDTRSFKSSEVFPTVYLRYCRKS